MGTLEIRLFGTLRVQRPGRPVSQFPTKRVKDLFSYLLIHRHDLHPRELLAELFWDGSKESNPRRCLNTALWRLQRVLGDPEPGGHPYLRVDAQRIGFNTASDSRLDVAEFESRCLWAAQVGPAAPDEQAAYYRQAVSLYQGDLLVDSYEEWCLTERERLQRLHLRALAYLADYHARRSEPAEAVEYGMRLLAVDPLREDVHRAVIQAYLDAGQPATARRQYQACLAILDRELGVGPAPETAALLPRILQATGPAGIHARTASPGGAPSLGGASSLGGAPSLGAPSPLGGASSLDDAVARLQNALAGFDQAQAELRGAAAAVADVAQVLLRAAPGAGPEVPAVTGEAPAPVARSLVRYDPAPVARSLVRYDPALAASLALLDEATRLIGDRPPAAGPLAPPGG